MASLPLTITGVLICAIGVALPFLPIGAWFGFTPLPGIYWLALAAILAAYMTLTQFVKTWMIRRFGLL
jgi:Mg2+-importing ATPase